MKHRKALSTCYLYDYFTSINATPPYRKKIENFSERDDEEEAIRILYTKNQVRICAQRVEYLRTPPTGILTIFPGVVILFLINGHSRLLPCVLTLAFASAMIVLLLSPSLSLYLLLLLGSSVHGLFFSFLSSFPVLPSFFFFSASSSFSCCAFREIPPSRDLSA